MIILINRLKKQLQIQQMNNRRQATWKGGKM